MRIETASLIGWISPTGQDIGFKLPIFFNSRQSNTLLIQQVDNLGRVVAFDEFETPEVMENTYIHRSLKSGDFAFWCFGIGNGDHLIGSKDEIISKINSNKIDLEIIPYVYMQIVNSFNLERERTSAQRLVYRKIMGDTDVRVALSWLDSEVFTPALRTELISVLRVSRRQRLIFSFFMEATCMTDHQVQIFIPAWIVKRIRKRDDWSHALVHRMQEISGKFDIPTSKTLNIVDNSFDPVKKFTNIGVDMLKDQAVNAFANARDVVLQRRSKSYYQNESGSVRVVCTFSSRYENRGKRKYWYGYHEMWDEWLRETQDAHLILGCVDTRIAFALPVQFLREIVHDLRSTGEGRNKFWHLDIVDRPGEPDLLDRARGMPPLELRGYAFEF